jgi:alkylation response protein AidB-like acyl-CoA dehydrogenase
VTAAATATLTHPDLDRLPEVTARLAATAAHYDQTAEFPWAGIRAVHEAGLLTAGVPARHGGAGLGVADLARVMLALGEGDPSVALIASLTILPLTFTDRRPWPPGLYERMLAEAAQRPLLLNNARAEPELGSPSRGGLPATTARRTAQGWSLTGRKRFVTGAEGLSYFLVWATTDEPSPRVGTFLVPAGTPGVEVIKVWDQLGLRASGTHDVMFTDVPVPAGDVLGLTPYGPAAQQDNLAGAVVHLLTGAIYVGVARAAQKFLHAFGRDRVPANLGAPIATTERFRLAAGEVETLLATAEQLILAAATQADQGEPVSGPAALAAKVIVARHAAAAVQAAVRLLGNPGLARGNPLERHFRDVQSAGVHAPQEDVCLLTIGAAAIAAAVPMDGAAIAATPADGGPR